MAKKSEPTAKEMYEKRIAEIRGLMEMLEKGLDKHEANFSRNDKNWAMVGDLQEIRDNLSNAVHYAH